MKRTVFVGLIAAAVVSVVATFCLWPGVSPSKKTTGKDNVPVIAQVLGVRVGKDTMERLDKILGRGATCMGGHPRGGRAWFIKSQNVYVYADGFDYSRHGDCIIDTIQIGFKKDAMQIGPPYGQPMPTIPKVSVGNRRIGWLGSVLPGMSRKRTLVLTSSLPKPKASGRVLRWTMEGTYKTSSEKRKDNWTAELTFDRGVLVLIDIGS